MAIIRKSMSVRSSLAVHKCTQTQLVGQDCILLAGFEPAHGRRLEIGAQVENLPHYRASDSR